MLSQSFNIEPQLNYNLMRLIGALSSYRPFSPQLEMQHQHTHQIQPPKYHLRHTNQQPQSCTHTPMPRLLNDPKLRGEKKLPQQNQEQPHKLFSFLFSRGEASKDKLTLLQKNYAPIREQETPSRRINRYLTSFKKKTLKKQVSVKGNCHIFPYPIFHPYQSSLKVFHATYGYYGAQKKSLSPLHTRPTYT